MINLIEIELNPKSESLLFSGNEKKEIESNRWKIFSGRRFGNNSVEVFSNSSGKFLIVIK